MKSPAFRLYPSDFWGSPDVQAMDLHEVGGYLSLLSNAWLSDRPGRLPDDDEKLRRWARMTREQWVASRSTLLAKFPIVEDGWRENPRLYREAEKQSAYSASQSVKGRKGGRPKAGDKPRLSENNPELSFGLGLKKPSVSVSVSDETTRDRSPSAPQLKPFLEAWNGNCKSLPALLKLSPSRTRKLSDRIKGGLTLEDFTKAVQIAAATPFLRGDNRNKWTISFDFLIDKDENLLKVLEGTYGEPEREPMPLSKGMTTAERARLQRETE